MHLERSTALQQVNHLPINVWILVPVLASRRWSSCLISSIRRLVLLWHLSKLQQCCIGRRSIRGYLWLTLGTRRRFDPVSIILRVVTILWRRSTDHGLLKLGLLRRWSTLRRWLLRIQRERSFGFSSKSCLDSQYPLNFSHSRSQLIMSASKYNLQRKNTVC
jgi:hypothetical protein